MKFDNKQCYNKCDYRNFKWHTNNWPFNECLSRWVVVRKLLPFIVKKNPSFWQFIDSKKNVVIMKFWKCVLHLHEGKFWK